MTENLWSDLTPDAVLNRIENATGQRLTPFIAQRNSYINRVYEVECSETKDRWVVKFYRPKRWTISMILNEHRLLKTLAEAEIPVIPPLEFNRSTLWDVERIPFTVFPKKWGRSVDALDREGWLQVGRLLGRMHATSRAMTDASDRIVWRPSVATQGSLNTLRNLEVVPLSLRPMFEKKVTEFIQKTDPLFSNAELFLIHGDCHYGNLISREAEFFLVDFDDCVVGPAIQDMWMLLPDSYENCKKEIGWFAEGYETFLDFPDASVALIPALTVMRQLHFASWCAIQKDESHFQHHFLNWGLRGYWEEIMTSIEIF